MFRPSSIRKAMLRGNIIHTPFLGVKAASSALKSIVSRKTFLNLLEEIKTIDSTELPNEIVNEVCEAFDVALDANNKSDLPYFYSKFTLCPRWAQFYSMLHRGKLHNAFEIYQPNPVMNILIERYEKLLLEKKDTAGFLRLYEKTHKIKLGRTEILSNFIRTCIEKKDDVSLAKFFESYILYTGPEELVKSEALQFDENLVKSMINFFAEVKQVKPYSKCVGYYIKKLEQNPRNVYKIEKIRIESKLTKFHIYAEKLGPLVVIENGMFNKFRILEGNKIGFKQLENYIQLLSIKLQNEDLSIDKMLLLIDQMNGLNIRPYKSAYTKALNPEIQMGRILKFIIDKTENKPDIEIVEKYNSIVEKYKNGIFTHLKDHIPKKFTKGQIASQISLNFKYKALSFEIIIRVLRNIKENIFTENSKETDNMDLNHIAEISAQIFTTMIRKHNLKPSISCFQDLYNIFGSSDKLKVQIPMIRAIECYFYPVTSKLNT